MKDINPLSLSLSLFEAEKKHELSSLWKYILISYG